MMMRSELDGGYLVLHVVLLVFFVVFLAVNNVFLRFLYALYALPVGEAGRTVVALLAEYNQVINKIILSLPLWCVSVQIQTVLCPHCRRRRGTLSQ